MSAARRESRGGWVISAVVAAAVLAVVLTLFRAPHPLPAPSVRVEPGLGLGRVTGAAADPVFREDADVHDPTPLFLPTKWNSAPLNPAEVLSREDEGPFRPFGPNLVFDDRELDLEKDLPPSHAMPARPADALAENPPTQAFIGYGRGDSRLPALAARGAFVEIVAVGTGRRVWARTLTGLPPGEADAPPEGGAWQFMAEVDAAGLVGSLVPKVGSGSAEVDSYFLNYLANTLRVGQRLSPGNYRISVGP